MICADALARIERRVRILEDHLHLAAERSQLAPRERGDVACRRSGSCRWSARAAARGSRPSVDLPQPDSPTMPSVSPRADLERDAVDRVHVLARPRGGRDVDRDREVLDEVDAPRGARARSPAAVTRSPAPARRRATRPAGQAAPPGRDGTRPSGPGRLARAAPAASRRARSGAGSGARTRQPVGGSQQRRRRAGNRREPADARPVDARDRAEQPPGVGMLRVAEDRRLGALLDHPARVHHARSARRSRRRRPCRA